MISESSKIGAVILAAGAGSRMGGVAKAMLQNNGRTFLASILSMVRVHDTVVVVGPPHGESVRSHATQLAARVVTNEHPERGMASSVALGFAALRADVDAAWLWPVDHPFVQPETLAALVAALGSHAAVRPTYTGRRGHPPLIARALFAQLAACADVEGGARTVLAAADTIDVPVDDPGILRDIDTPADLEAT